MDQQKKTNQNDIFEPQITNELNDLPVTSEVDRDQKLKTLEPAKSTNMVGVGALVEQLRVKRNEKHVLSQSLDVTGLSK